MRRRPGAALTRVSSPVGLGHRTPLMGCSGEDVSAACGRAGDGGPGACSVRGFALKQGGGAYLKGIICRFVCAPCGACSALALL